MQLNTSTFPRLHKRVTVVNTFRRLLFPSHLSRFLDKDLLTNEERINAPLTFASGCALWLLSHPYWGIWHDARVYTLMALRWLDPSAFTRDPWFMFGSQDSFSIFSPFYAGLIALLGIENAAKLGTLSLGLLFIVACWLLCRSLPLKTGKYLVFLLLASTSLIYCFIDHTSDLAFFKVSEGFITSRNLASSISIISLSLAFRKRKLAALLLSLLSIAFHPLMGIWTLLVLLPNFIELRPRTTWLLGATTVFLIAGLSFFDIGIFKQMPGEWSQYVQTTSRMIFADTRHHRPAFFAAVYSLLYAASRFGTPPLRIWYMQILAISFFAYILFWFCSNFAPSTLIMQLQLWRCNWLALTFAIIAIVDLTVQALLGRTPRRFLFLAAGGALLVPPLITASILLICGTFPCQTLHLARSVLKHFSRRFWHILSITILIGWTVHLFLEMETLGIDLWRYKSDLSLQPRGYQHEFATPNFISGILFSGANGIVPFFVWILLFSRFRKLATTGAIILALTLTPDTWLKNNTEKYNFDQRHFPQFSAHIKPGDVVYWQNHSMNIYYFFRTASYVSHVQAIGLVFSEAMTEEIARRLQRVALARSDNNLITSPLSARNKVIASRRYDTANYFDPDDLYTYEALELSRPGLNYICEDPQLDYVIHDAFFPELHLATETVLDQTGKKNPLYLYACQDIRDRTSTM